MDGQKITYFIVTGLDWTALLVIFLVLLGIGVYGSRTVANEETYLLAKRGLGLFPLTATLVMTEFNTSTLIACSSLGVLASFWALTLPFVFLVGLLFYSAVVAEKWKEFNALSVAQFFTARYGSAVGKFASVSLLAAMAGFSAVYVKSITLLLHPLFPEVPFWLLSLALVGAVLGVMLRGGLVAVVQTDSASFILLCIVMPLILFFSWRGGEVPPFDFQMAQEVLPPWLVVSLIFLTLFTYILAPWYGQKIFAAKSPSIARRSVFFAAILVFCFYAMAVLATVTVHSSFTGGPDAAFPHLILYVLPNGIRGVAYAFLFSAAATTLTGVWSAMTTMIVADFLGKKGDLTGSIGRSMCLTLVFATLSYLLANLFIDAIFQKLILANIPVLALSFALLGGFYWPKVTTAAALVSMSVGLVWGVSCYLYFGEAGGYQWYWVMFGLPLIFGSGSLCTLLAPRIPNRRIQGVARIDAVADVS